MVVTTVLFLLCISVNAFIVSVVPDSAAQGDQLNVSVTGQKASFRIGQDSGLVGHWQFNEGSGDSIHDISVFNNHAKVESATWSTGINSGALEFNVVDDSIHIPHSASLASPVYGITMEAWFCAYSFNPGQNHIINKYGNYALSVNNGVPAIAVRVGSHVWWTPAIDSVPINEWVHFVGTFDGQQKRIFINGAMAAEDNLTGTINQNIVGNFEIAGGHHGMIDEICVFNYALLPAEIEERYNSFIGPRPELIAVTSPTYNRRPVLKWHAYQGASSYTVQVDTTTTFLSPVLLSINVSDTTFTPLADLPIATIYWRVGAGQPIIYSTPGFFIIQDSLTPMLIQYEPNPTLERRPTLKWHDVTGVSTYYLMVDNDISFLSTEVSISVGDTFFTPLADLPVGWIYWKAKSDLSDQYSEMSSFIIQSDTVPFLYSFKGVAVANKRPAFRWKPVTGADAYKIEIDTASSFSSPVVSIELSDTIFTPLADLEYKLHYWHVSSGRNMALFSPTDSVRITDQSGVDYHNIMTTVPMLSVFPNPFQEEVKINLGKPLGKGDYLSIYSMDGKLIKQFSFSYNAGKSYITWDGRNRNGRMAGNGIYIIKLKSGDKILNKRLISIR